MEDVECVWESGLLRLADELIDMILCYSFIDHKDLCRCAQVCRRLNVISSGNELWRRKALNRWVFWTNLPNDNWWSVYKDRILMETKVVEALQIMAKKYYTKPEVYRSELDRLAYLTDKNLVSSQHVDNTLTELLQGDNRKTNLTHRHYARKVQIHLKLTQLRKDWQNLFVLPEDEQKLEEGSMLISKWILSTEEVNENDAHAELDEIARLVQNYLSDAREMNTATMTSMDSSFARAENEVVTDPTTCLRILECVKHVLFEKLRFKGNSSQYYKRSNSMLHQVLKCRTGNPITLSVVFEAVSRRLGVKLEPVNFPNHFLLRWRANQDPGADDAIAYKYIDCFNGGRFLSEEQCSESLLSPMTNPTSRESLFVQASPKQVFTRMVNNIINSYRTAEQEDDGLRGLRSALDLLLFLNPDDKTMRLLQARIQVHLGVDLEEAIDSLQSLMSNSVSIRRGALESLLERANEKYAQRDLEDETAQPKLRSDPSNSQVGFKVGMVMRHKLYNYGCVIYGWDPVCKMDELWIQQMGVDRSPNGRNQPFYNVLGNDSSTRYAAHENLRQDPDQPFNLHPEIGKHFKAFTGTRYIPNEFLQEKYPEDIPDELSS